MTPKKNELQIKTDQQLLSEIKHGKMESFDELFTRHIRYSYYLAIKYLKNRDAAEIVVQNIWADLWINIDRKNIHKFKPYLSCAVSYQARSVDEQDDQSLDSFIDTILITKYLSVWLDKISLTRKKPFKPEKGD